MMWFLFVTIFCVVANSNALTHSQALSLLNAAGITVSSSGGCSDKTKSTCTSLDGIRQNTIDGIITFHQASGCKVVITGGTETGHASGTYSHANGYKVDISKSAGEPCISNYIHAHYTSIGGNKYESAAGNVYYDEDQYHWDITYY